MFTKDSTTKEIRTELDKLPKNQQILFVADVARSVLHHFEDKFPNDKRSRLAIEMAESLKFDSKIADAAWNDDVYSAWAANVEKIRIKGSWESNFT